MNPEFKIGQLVKAVWEDGETTVSGFLREATYESDNDLRLEHVGWSISTLLRDGFTITVLKEPPINEPTGYNALVLLKDDTVMRRFGSGYWVPYGYAEGGAMRSCWSQFAHQVAEVLYPGRPR